ncbi:hypothetical protein [Polaromonas sp.]|uniref:hypothetical protein n=1 Tax=Polaromonas sp. TaxID=1869339 RepID=UPI00272F7751|nr:hypothetical protein [Polaromonas sp.]MDP1742926.1 hypothetical protein [Polaromonas sp.]
MKNLILVLVVGCFCGGAMAQDPSVACIQQLGGDDRLQSLFKKAPLDISKGQPLEVLANQSKATAKEKAALSILVSELDRCTELGADWRKQNYPASINGYGNTYQSFLRSAIAELYAGKLTFGDFAKARDRELTELLNKVSQEVQQIQAQRAGEKRQQEQAANAAEEQRRAAARRSADQAEAQRRYEEQQAMQAEESRRQATLQYLLNQRQVQPYQVQPYQIPIPKTTNCTTFGGQTNCITR